MSFHYLQGRAEESWEGSCLDGAPDALLNLIPTQDGYCSQGKPTDASHDSQSGMTSPPSTASPGEGTSTLSAADSHARTSAAPGTVLGSAVNALAYGENFPESFVRYDPYTCSWRTRQCSLLGGFTEFSGTWPRWGSMRGGECWERQTQERHIYARGFGSWPTPCRIDEDFCRMTVKSAQKTGHQPHVTTELIRIHGQRFPLPSFGMWLMGWPDGWAIAGEPLGMARFRKWLRSHGVS